MLRVSGKKNIHIWADNSNIFFIYKPYYYVQGMKIKVKKKKEIRRDKNKTHGRETIKPSKILFCLNKNDYKMKLGLTD